MFSFNLIGFGIYVEELNAMFGRMKNIRLDNYQLQKGKGITDKRKELLYTIYKVFGKMSSTKLYSEISDEGSPIHDIRSSPELLYIYMVYKIGVPKSVTKKWFSDTFLQY